MASLLFMASPPTPSQRVPPLALALLVKDDALSIEAAPSRRLNPPLGALMLGVLVDTSRDVLSLLTEFDLTLIILLIWMPRPEIRPPDVQKEDHQRKSLQQVAELQLAFLRFFWKETFRPFLSSQKKLGLRCVEENLTFG